jgi:hypothetical protein
LIHFQGLPLLALDESKNDFEKQAGITNFEQLY